MTEEEKGAPVWGEEPVKQSGEDEGLPGKAAPAAGTAAPEMGGTSQVEETAPVEAGEEAPAREAAESREEAAPAAQEAPESGEAAGSEEGLPGKAAPAAGAAAPETGGTSQAGETAPVEAGEEAPAQEAEESREGTVPVSQEGPESGEAAGCEEGLPGKAASAAGAAAPEMGGTSQVEETAPVEAGEAGPAQEAEESREGAAPVTQEAPETGGAPQAAPYGQAPWQQPMPQGPTPWQGYPGYGAGQPGAYPGYGAPQQGYQAPQGYYMPQNGYGYPAQGGYPQQPVYGQQGGYPYGQQPYYGGQPGYVPYGAPPVPPQPKKKLPLGLKVFLWVASILAAGAVLGFAIYLGYSASTGTGAFQAPYEDYLPELPYEDEEPGESQAQEETEEEELPPLPEVDVTPNDQGIQIEEKPEGEAMDAQAVYDKVAPSTVTVTVRRDPDSEKPDSTGTGIIATADGYIITNAHVVLHSKSVYVKVTTYDGQEYDAVVVGSDRTTDLAVIKTNDYGFTPAQFGDADELSIGEWVLAIGNPGGERFSSSLTRGIISGLDREVGEYSENGMTYIQTDAAINPGNSGGPLVNMYGQVVGINSSKIMTEGYEGMGFAIPVSTAKNIIDQLLAGGYVEGRVRLGIMGREIDGTMAMIYGLPQGFLISEIQEGSSFLDTEAQVGDVITAIDGNEVTSLSEISNLLLRYSPGDQVTVTLFRQNDSGVGGEEIDVTITLLEDRGETQE